MPGLCFTLYCLSLSCQFVKLFSAYLYRRVHRRKLHNISDKLALCCLQLFKARSCSVLGKYRSRNILSVGSDTQPEACKVDLCRLRKYITRFCCLSHKHGKNSLRHRIQSSRMPQPLYFQYSPQLCNNVEGSPADRLIYGNYSAQFSVFFHISSPEPLLHRRVLLPLPAQEFPGSHSRRRGYVPRR